MDPYPKKKYPLGDDYDGMNPTEGKLQGESETHSMGGNGESRNMITSMMQGFKYMTHNIILSEK